MSNDLIASLKQQLAALPGGVDEETRAIAGLNGPVNKRISIEGGVFRKYAGGKEVGTIEDRHMNVIVVKAGHGPSRTFYSQAYKKGVKISPECWSTDSKTPDAEVAEPQSKTCEMCPNAVKGSGQNGQGMACRRSWRAAVVLPNDPSGDVMQIVIPDKSIWGDEEAGRWPFRAYGRMLANNNISIGRVITKMQFDTSSSAPRLLFSPSGIINVEDLEVLERQSKSIAAEKAVKMTVYKMDTPKAEAKALPEVVDEDVASFSANDLDEVVEPTVAPKLRETKRSDASPDVSATLKKWTK
jgi:hypothetical protein